MSDTTLKRPLTTEGASGEVVAFARRLDGLHQLLYSRGGIKPTNAAVEELSKLLFLRIATERHPDVGVPGFRTLSETLDPAFLEAQPTTDGAKAAFKVANKLKSFSVDHPGGGGQPVWPEDEPLRISRSDILAEAVRILADAARDLDRSHDPIGTAFDVFLRGRYEHSGGLGTYLTPANVVRLMTTIGLSLLEVNSSRQIQDVAFGDPCCGSGRFLLGFLHELQSRNNGVELSDLSRNLIGADQSSSSLAMARVNLLAAGIDAPQLFLVEDSITDYGLDERLGTINLILTNPPFGDGKYDSREGVSRTAAVLPNMSVAKRLDPALAFVGRCIELLAPDGVAGIILPDGVADGPTMRSLLLESSTLFQRVALEGVVSLPSATFAPAGTTAKTSVVFLRKATKSDRKTVFMSRANHVGYVMKGGKIATDPDGDDLSGIAIAIQEFVAKKPPSTGQLVQTLELGSLRSLDASTLDSTADGARALLVNHGGVEARTLLKSLGKRRRSTSADMPFVSVLHVDELGNIDWSQALSYYPTTPGQIAKEGEVIISLLNPSKFRAAVIPSSHPQVQCSAEFGVFEASIDPYAMLALLQNPLVRSQIAPMGRGTSSSRRRVDAEDILGVLIPSVDKSWIKRAATITRLALDKVAEGRTDLKSIYDEIEYD